MLADYDQRLYTLYFGVFVGHTEMEFDARAGGIVVNQFSFKKFKLVVLTSLVATPSHYSTAYTTAVTLRPELASDAESKDTLRSYMSGKASDVCLRQYVITIRSLIRGFWEDVLPTLDNEKDIRFAKERIAEVSDVELAELELDREKLLVHTLRGEKPPNLR